jgi:hypothetical protein
MVLRGNSNAQCRLCSGISEHSDRHGFRPRQRQSRQRYGDRNRSADRHQSADHLRLGWSVYAPVSGATDFTTLGSNSANKLPSQSVQFYGTWSTTRGRHNLRLGTNLRQYVLNTTSFGNSAGSFSFSANNWVKQSNSAPSTVVQGQDLAEFLLGLPTSGQFDLNAAAGYYEHYGAVFVQDDWRVHKNLTVNLGLRFDYDAPYREKYGRTVDGFETTTPNPLAPAAIAAYNAHPIPQIPVGSFDVLGGLTYPTDGSLYNQTSHLFSPRGVCVDAGRA